MHQGRVDPAYVAELEARKHASTLQLLFKCARLANEEAVAQVRATGGPAAQLRASHTSLFPHIDLEGTRLTTLATRLGISKQAVGQLVAELIDLGVLSEVPDPSDGRAKLIKFSARGRRGLLQGLGLLGRLERQLGAEIGPEQMQALGAALRRLLPVLEARAARVMTHPR